MKTKIILLSILIITMLILATIVLFFGGKSPVPTTPNPTPRPQQITLPSNPAIKQSQEINTSTRYSVSFNLKTNRVFPEKINTISVNRSISAEKIKNIQQTLQILSEPQQVDDNTFLWLLDGDLTSLLTNIRSGYIEYNATPYEAKSDPGGTQIKKISQGEAEKIAEKIIKDLNIIQILPGSASVQTFKRPAGEHFEETEDINEIQLYQFTYQQSYEGLPIYQQLGHTATIRIGVSVYGRLSSIQFFSSTPINSKETQLISLEEARTKIQQNEGSIVRLDDAQNSSISISSITIESIDLGYLDDKVETTLIPIYVFEGVAQTSFGQKRVTLYLPAY